MALLLTVATGAWAQDPDPIDLTPSADGTVWTLSTMPEYDVELEVTYYTDVFTVYFTDAQNYGDVNVYFWPDGRAWPGEAMTEVETNEFGQKIYKAVIPAGTEGIIFNNGGNGKQTVDITENISKNAWWYTTDATDGSGHNQVVYNDIYIELTKGAGNNWTFEMPDGDVELEIEYEPDYYVTGTMTNPAWTIDAANQLQPNTEVDGEYYIHNVTLTAGTELKVVSDGAVWYPSEGGNYVVPRDATYSIYFRPLGGGGDGWHYGYIYAQLTSLDIAANEGETGEYWATYYDTSLSFTADANTTVYQAALNGNYLTLTEVENREIPAGNAVILKSSADKITLTPGATSATINGNVLQGTTAAIEGSAGNIYVLNKVGDQVGFYKLAATGTLGANKAYLTVSEPTAPSFLGFSFGETTGINSIDNGQLTIDNSVYDLQGRRVQNPSKGLYIVNGKKVVIK